MKSNILLICILTIFTLSSCDMINNDNKWSHTKFSRIAKSERSQATCKNHDKNIYGTWQQEKNPDIILKFYDDSRWQYKKGTPDTWEKKIVKKINISKELYNSYIKTIISILEV